MHDPALVLIVDDDPLFIEIFQTELTSAGYTVETATTGTDGVEKAKASKPDLILMDVKMPGMEGTEAALAIKAVPELRETKIVFLTSLGDPNTELPNPDAKLAKGFGFEGYIRKTEDLTVMLQKVKGFLG